MPKRIAIIGSGISGLVCARLLATEHDVVLFEAADSLGGHTHTVDVEAFGKTWTVDTGFMVFNDRTYPNFTRMLDLLGIEPQLSDMSFSVRCDQINLEYQGSSLDGLFAQRRNLIRPSFYRMIRDILRFNRTAPALLKKPDKTITLREYLHKNRYSEEFSKYYLLPMTAAIWSSPTEGINDFPAVFLVQFMQNHGLLTVRDQPQWKTIPGGARNYIHALVNPLRDSVRINSKVTSAVRENDGVTLKINNEQLEQFDHAVFACHSPQSLEILADASSDERTILGAFRYQPNTAYLHTDISQLPKRSRAWASWNYRSTGNAKQPVSVTYDLSRLQNVRSPTPILLTLNPIQPVNPAKVLQIIDFEHPLFDQHTRNAQAGRDLLHEEGKVFYCGAYWGYGFHEDGLVSALNVCQHFGKTLEDINKPCRVVSTKVE